MAELPVLPLDGPKAVTKTETATSRARTVVRRNRERELQLLDARLDSLRSNREPADPYHRQ